MQQQINQQTKQTTNQQTHTRNTNITTIKRKLKIAKYKTQTKPTNHKTPTQNNVSSNSVQQKTTKPIRNTTTKQQYGTKTHKPKVIHKESQQQNTIK